MRKTMATNFIVLAVDWFWLLFPCGFLPSCVLMVYCLRDPSLYTLENAQTLTLCIMMQCFHIPVGLSLSLSLPFFPSVGLFTRNRRTFSRGALAQRTGYRKATLSCCLQEGINSVNNLIIKLYSFTTT